MTVPPTFIAGDKLKASQMNKIGLWLVNTTTLSGDTAKNIDSCFTSDYTNYLLVATLTTNSDNTLIYRLRASGTTNTGLNVDTLLYYQTWGTATVNGSTTIAAQDYAICGYSDATYGASINLNIYRPQDTAYTFSDYTSTGGDFTARGNARHTVTTAYDGIRITTSTGTPTLTGTINIYGYNKG